MAKLPIRPQRKPPLTIDRILEWADAFRERTGRWPQLNDGEVHEAPGQTWGAADRSLNVGTRGLPGGTTLAKLLKVRRGRRHWHLPPDLSIEMVLQWADRHHGRTGSWPSAHQGGQVRGAPAGTTWTAIEIALLRGNRGLPAGWSIARLLSQHRGVRNRLEAPLLRESVILEWIDLWKARTERWPKYTDGLIPDASGETWAAIDTALLRGLRGLGSGSSLAKFLTKHRGVRNRSYLPPLHIETIRLWVVAYRNRTNRWPTSKSGAVLEAPGETWGCIHQALKVGQRGLPGGSSLPEVIRSIDT
jgi:hypothetical protein